MFLKLLKKIFFWCSLIILTILFLPYIPSQRLQPPLAGKYSKMTHAYYTPGGKCYFKGIGFGDSTYFYKSEMSFHHFEGIVDNMSEVQTVNLKKINFPKNFYFKSSSNQTYFIEEKKFPNYYIYDHDRRFAYIKINL